MDFNFFSQADQAGFELEKARRALETAKIQLEIAKQAFEDVMNRAEENGVTKPKLRRLVEERVTSLFESGFAENSIMSAGPTKTPVRVVKKLGKKSDRIADDSLESMASDSSAVHTADNIGDGTGGGADDSTNHNTHDSTYPQAHDVTNEARNKNGFVAAVDASAQLQ